jgi:transcriptional regulator with XRE-family HTH domain
MSEKESKKLGENMRRIRIEKGMSQGDICRALNLDRAHVCNIENGRQNPTLDTIAKIAKALGVEVSELMK